ncbi:MAG: beta-glucosidase BglX [Clostridia bacterium]|nr:beta-glucosidase BglX [Clostridia bacterium]
MTKEKLLNLLNQMTLEEKIGQMVQVIGKVFLMDKFNNDTGPLKKLKISKQMLDNVGSILNLMGAENIRKVQYEYLSKSRLKIPLMFMSDIINGYKLAFPIPIAQGCSWNINVIKEIAKISAYESNISGANVNFSPMVDLSRDARWGRVMESVGGEDSYLGKVYADSIVNAYQGSDISKAGNIVSCVKHIAAYGAVEAGRDYNTVDMSEREFRNNYLPAYKSAIDAGAKMLMTSFNIINGIPATINKFLLQDIIRKELGFKGVIISDYSAIEETIKHGVSKNEQEAALNAINAGVDIDMMSGIYANNLGKLCFENIEIENKINESVLRILNLKNELGLFENPYGNSNKEKEKIYLMNNSNLEKAKELVQETFVLLKNNNHILPLNKKQNISLIGPYANNTAITGSWSIFSDRDKNTTLLEAFKNNNFENVLYSKGSEILRTSDLNKILLAEGENLIYTENEKELEEKMIEEAKNIASHTDIILLALGEHYKQSGEACSKSRLDLPENQVNLIKSLYTLNKPMIMILFNGRPVEISNIEKYFEAILDVWFPGTVGAEAIVNVISGLVNPSGKLTMSFPQNVGQCPIYYNHYNTGRPHDKEYKYMSRYQDIPTQSFYPFGFGLSYCDFKYSNLMLNKDKMTKDEKITVCVDIENLSNYEGYEVIQLYIQDLFGSTVRPVKELKAFKKIFFKAKEKKQIYFQINEEMLKFWNRDLKFIAEEGEFEVYVGGNSKDTLSCRFSLIN